MLGADGTAGPEPRDPDWQQRCRAIFSAAPFISHVGYRLTALAPGTAESELLLRPDHLQHDGIVHAGVQATMADHTAGTAAATLMAATDIVLTVEFKTNLFAPARGEKLVCRALVLKPGRRIAVAEGEVYAVAAAGQTLVSKTTVTLAYVPAKKIGSADGSA